MRQNPPPTLNTKTDAMKDHEYRVAIMLIATIATLLIILFFVLFVGYNRKAEDNLSLSAPPPFPPFDTIDQFKLLFYERYPEFISRCRAENLTARETELAALKEIGISNHRIADLMGISQGTVYTLTKRVKKKQAKT